MIIKFIVCCILYLSYIPILLHSVNNTWISGGAFWKTTTMIKLSQSPKRDIYSTQTGYSRFNTFKAMKFYADNQFCLPAHKECLNKEMISGFWYPSCF